MKVTSLKRALLLTLYVDSTRPLRLMLALVEWFFALYLINEAGTAQFEKMLEVHSMASWVVAFLAHSVVMIYGLTGRYSRITFWFEGMAGMFLWWITAITHWAAQGYPGPTFACALAMTIIYANYPTHKDWRPYE